MPSPPHARPSPARLRRVALAALLAAPVAAGCPATTRHQVELDRVDIDLGAPTAPGASAGASPAPAAALTPAEAPRVHLPRIDETLAVREELGRLEDFEAIQLSVGGDDLVRVLVDARSKTAVYFSPVVYPTHAAFIASYLEGRPAPDSRWMEGLASQVAAPGSPLLLLDLVRTSAGVWALSFWEGARPSAEDIRVAYVAVAGSFFGARDMLFRPLTPSQSRAAEAAKTRGVKVVANRGFYSAAKARVGRPGRATGRIKLTQGAAAGRLGRGDVAVLRDPVLDLPPVAGAVRGTFTTPTANAAVRALVDGTPFGWLDGARDQGMMLLGRPAALEVDASADPVVRLHRASGGRAGAAVGRAVEVYPLQGAVRDLRLVDYLARTHAGAFGTTAANAGALRKLKLPGAHVARGFAVPLAFYMDRLRAGGLRDKATAAYTAQEPAARAALLEGLRRDLLQGPVPAELEAQLKLRLQRLRLKPGESLRVTPSVNADGLPWLGPPARVDAKGGVAALEQAVRQAWASPWTEEAVAARVAAGLGPQEIGVGVLVQVAPARAASGLARVGGTRGQRARLQVWDRVGLAPPTGPADEVVLFDRAAMHLWIARRPDQPRRPRYSEAEGLRFEVSPRADRLAPTLTAATVHALSTLGRNAAAGLPGRGTLGMCFERDGQGIVLLAATRLSGR